MFSEYRWKPYSRYNSIIRSNKEIAIRYYQQRSFQNNLHGDAVFLLNSSHIRSLSYKYSCNMNIKLKLYMGYQEQDFHLSF